jgi:hypothetical protein
LAQKENDMLDCSRYHTIPALALAAALGLASSASAQVPVRVTNGERQPVPVVVTAPADVNVLSLPPLQSRPAATRMPFQREFYIEVPSGSLSASQSFMVPVGKRLVLEFAAGNTRLSDWEYVRLTLRTIAGGESVGHELAPTTYRRAFEGSDPPFTPDLVIGFSQLVRIYADPGSSVSLTFLRTENREARPGAVAASVSGYLVDCGPEPGCPVP